MVEKIEVRTTSGGFIEVTRCEEGVVWVDIKRGDGTQSLTGRLDGFGPTDLAAALDPKLMTRAAAKDLREKYDQACKSSVANAEAAYQLQGRVKVLEASTSHGAYQKLNDELAKAKAEVASLQGQMVGRGAALHGATERGQAAEKRCKDLQRQVDDRAQFQEGYAKLRAEHVALLAREAEAGTLVAGETWKQRDARHRETIHQLKQENANLRRNAEAGRKDREYLKKCVAALTATYASTPLGVPQSEAAHVMSLTKQLADVQQEHRFCEGTKTSWIKVAEQWKAKYDAECVKLQELKLAGKICAEAMQEWRSKLTSECGFTYPNLTNLNDILRQIREWKTRPTETHYVTDDGTRKQFIAAAAQWDKDAAGFNRRINELRALAAIEAQAREALEKKTCVANSEYNRMLELRRGDQETVKRCSDRVKELEERASTAKAVLSGLIAHTGRKP